ncbi:MAG: hypothetical protein M1840_006322 [Geoglossum simile]|nr:MAG: hypothetical protein M1840_006322 [Geoglossum simile]
MSTADPVNITPPTEAFLAIVRKYASDIREAIADKQTRSVVGLELRHVCNEVQVFLEKHHEKTVRDYSIDSERSGVPLMFLFNGQSCTPIREGFVLLATPLLITGSITARVRYPGNPADPVQPQEGSMWCAVGAAEAYLDVLGDGKVVWVFMFCKVKA